MGSKAISAKQLLEHKQRSVLPHLTPFGSDHPDRFDHASTQSVSGKAERGTNFMKHCYETAGLKNPMLAMIQSDTLTFRLLVYNFSPCVTFHIAGQQFYILFLFFWKQSSLLLQLIPTWNNLKYWRPCEDVFHLYNSTNTLNQMLKKSGAARKTFFCSCSLFSLQHLPSVQF